MMDIKSNFSTKYVLIMMIIQFLSLSFVLFNHNAYLIGLFIGISVLTFPIIIENYIIGGKT
jgi:hypothetical protein